MQNKYDVIEAHILGSLLDQPAPPVIQPEAPQGAVEAASGLLVRPVHEIESTYYVQYRAKRALVQVELWHLSSDCLHTMGQALAKRRALEALNPGYTFRVIRSQLAVVEAVELS